MQSEFDFINRIRNKVAKRRDADLVLGIGDDASILREQSGRESLVTVDLLVEDVDFKLEYTPPRWLGHKALAVSLSDIAAMGGAPSFALLTLAIPRTIPRSEIFWEEFFAGYFTLAERYGVTLIGGDISAAPDRLMIDSFVIGRCPAGKAITRGGARAGDGIYLSGTVGASAAGLKLLSNGARVNESENGLLQNSLRAHLKPEPRVDFGRDIGETGLVHAMIDVSDGLAQDLGHICEESQVSAIVDFELVPVAKETSLVAEDRAGAFSFAVGGGEDFELLLTANTSSEDKLMNVAARCGLGLIRIGEIIECGKTSNPVFLRHQGVVNPLLTRGYDHFIV